QNVSNDEINEEEIKAEPEIKRYTVFIVKTKADASKNELNVDLLKEYKTVGIWFEEICREFPRILWINTTADAKAQGLNTTFICKPYTESFDPDLQPTIDLLGESESNTSSAVEPQLLRIKRELNDGEEGLFLPSASLITIFKEQGGQRKVTKEKLFPRKPSKQLNNYTEEELGWSTKPPGLDLNSENPDIDPVAFINDVETARKWQFNLDPTLFKKHQKIGINLAGVCSDVVPDTVSEFDMRDFHGVKIEGPIGINMTTINMSLPELAELLRNDTEVDRLIRTYNATDRPLASSFILPTLRMNNYDARQPPALFEGQAVLVRLGIFIQSMSNFETTTMDYDTDIWLRMGWRDPRLAHGLSKPILINEETFLEKLWRPDPFFKNAKEASFQRVTFLNFVMQIFPDGAVFFETKLYLKPSCQLVLCKYPHDKQRCSLRVSSLAYTHDVVKFRWFSRAEDALRKADNVQLPELYIVGYAPKYCDGLRKTGNFSCLEAEFDLQRDIGFHLAQTYIPTALCLVFSWVAVWLPEEFVEGRVFVALTVFLTLSAESASSKEFLPKVSYITAIDIWFGFTSMFVFLTLLQTLTVIMLESASDRL
uniref:Uncharacterized protein n=1 Tax=Plectus sambesii TaxID=2011161 RepID=A0A914XIM8_9BILA